jgi:hypothetical protein
MKKIRPFRLLPKPLSREAEEMAGFQWARGDIGTRHKLGGMPDLIQESQWPRCPACDEDMSSVAQIDSVNDEFLFGDCGMIYVFYCFACGKSSSFSQSY